MSGWNTALRDQTIRENQVEKICARECFFFCILVKQIGHLPPVVGEREGIVNSRMAHFRMICRT